MKKIFSLFMVAAIVLTMSFAAMAADPIQGMHTIITETDDDITVTVKVGNVVNLSGLTSYLITDDVTYVADSAVKGDKFGAYTLSPTTNKSGYIKFVLSTTDSANYITEAGEFVALTYKVTKVKDGELETADFAYGTGTLDISKVTTPTGGTVAGVAAGNNFTSKKQASYFTVEYVDERTKDEEPITVVTKAEVVTEAWTAEFKYPTDKVGGTGSAVEGKKVSAFGKNSGKETLTSGNYGIKIGNRFYPGRIDVPAGKHWAIIIVNSNGDEAIKDSYKFKVYTGTEADPTFLEAEFEATVE